MSIALFFPLETFLGVPRVLVSLLDTNHAVHGASHLRLTLFGTSKTEHNQ